MLDNKQWSLWKVEQMRGVLWLPQLTLWMNFPGYSQRKDMQTGDLLELRRKIWKFGEVKAAREENRWKERCMGKTTAQSSQEQRRVLPSLQLNNDKHLCAKNYLRPVKETPERVEIKLLGGKNSLCSTRQRGKSIINRASHRLFSKGEIVSLQWKDTLTKL